MLRVISGEAKGLKLVTLDSDKTRPTTDRVKESLFNIIAPFVENAVVLDLFSGTGSLAIEALSRGAKSAVLVDSNQECTKIIKRNLENTKYLDKAQVYNLDFASAINRLASEDYKFDLIFLDPPYSKAIIDISLKLLEEKDLVLEDAVIVAEKEINDIVPETEGSIRLVRKQKYGNTELCFYRKFQE